MKIAILTFHRALNYGALLQAFALQKILEYQGNQVEILDYRNDVIEKAYYFPRLKERHNLKSIVKFILQGKSEIKRRENFEVFRNERLKLSSNIYTKENIDKSNALYELFITGSDQVWNYKAHDFDGNYFLQFVKNSNKKRSFAASIGLNDVPREYEEQYFKFLNDFVLCSVREQQGLKILNRLGITKGRVDIDPTFLLKRDEWVECLGIKKSNERFIFAYYFEVTPELKSFVESLSKKTGYCVRYLGYALKAPFECKCEAIKTAGPIEFVESMYNAEYIVTNSFHGTAFSINFNKRFYVELLKRGADVNSRLINILEYTGLDKRKIDKFETVEAALEAEINWEIINKKMDVMRNTSMSYIREITK